MTTVVSSGSTLSSFVEVLLMSRFIEYVQCVILSQTAESSLWFHLLVPSCSFWSWIVLIFAASMQSEVWWSVIRHFGVVARWPCFEAFFKPVIISPRCLTMQMPKSMLSDFNIKSTAVNLKLASLFHRDSFFCRHMLLLKRQQSKRQVVSGNNLLEWTSAEPNGRSSWLWMFFAALSQSLILSPSQLHTMQQSVVSGFIGQKMDLLPRTPHMKPKQGAAHGAALGLSRWVYPVKLKKQSRYFETMIKQTMFDLEDPNMGIHFLSPANWDFSKIKFEQISSKIQQIMGEQVIFKGIR